MSSIFDDTSDYTGEKLVWVAKKSRDIESILKAVAVCEQELEELKFKENSFSNRTKKKYFINILGLLQKRILDIQSSNERLATAKKLRRLEIRAKEDSITRDVLARVATARIRDVVDEERDKNKSKSKTAIAMSTPIYELNSFAHKVVSDDPKADSSTLALFEWAEKEKAEGRIPDFSKRVEELRLQAQRDVMDTLKISLVRENKDKDGPEDGNINDMLAEGNGGLL